MNLSKAAKIWIDYHKTHSKKNTVRAYQTVIERFINSDIALRKCVELKESPLKNNSGNLFETLCADVYFSRTWIAILILNRI